LISANWATVRRLPTWRSEIRARTLRYFPSTTKPCVTCATHAAATKERIGTGRSLRQRRTALWRDDGLCHRVYTSTHCTSRWAPIVPASPAPSAHRTNIARRIARRIASTSLSVLKSPWPKDEKADWTEKARGHLPRIHIPATKATQVAEGSRAENYTLHDGSIVIASIATSLPHIPNPLRHDRRRSVARKAAALGLKRQAYG